MQDNRQSTNSRPLPPRPRPVTDAGLSITPKEIVDIIRRHLILIILLTFFGSMLGGTSWFLLRKYSPKYTANTYIEVLSPGQSDPSVLTKGVANKDIAYEHRFSKAVLIKQQGLLQDLIKRDKVRDTKWFKKFNNDVAEAIDDLKDNLGASPDRNSSYIVVSMTCGDAVESALIVNEMVDLFVKNEKTKAEAGVSGKLQQLSTQENELLDNLRNLNTSLADIRSSTGITQLENLGEGSFRHTITQKLANLEIEKITLEADIEQIQTTVQNYEKRSITDDIITRTTEDDRIILTLTQKINDLEAELARKQTNLGENHREVQQIKELLKQTIADKEARSDFKSRQIKESDVATIKDQLVVLTNRMAKLEELRAQTENEQRELDNAKASYDQKTSDREEIQNKLFAVREQISKYNQIKEDAESAKVIPVGLAQVPLVMSSPNILMHGAGGTFLGFMLGIGLAFLIELLNDLLRTPSDVIKHVKIPLLGMITHKNLDSATKKANMQRVVSQHPYSIVSECYRQFRTNLKLSGNTGKQQLIFITSATAEEGRTTVAANTAATFAAEEKKVLFIDANFRRPTSSKIFPQIGGDDSSIESPNQGLSGCLLGKCNIQDAIRQTGVYKTDVIDSGKLPKNPAELFSGSNMTALIKFARENYDRIIIDGPPMLVSDAKVLAGLADGTVLVFNTAITKRGAANRIVRELNEVNANLLGAVLIGVRVLKGGYFREMFESYQDYQIPQTAATAK